MKLGNMQNKLKKKKKKRAGGGIIWHGGKQYGMVRVEGGSGINKQTLTRAAVENQPGEQRGLRSGADSPV